MSAICSSCGRNLDKEFVYCPWCGQQKIRHDQEFFNMIYDRYSKSHKEQREMQFRAVEKQLDELEQELEVLVLSAEMHK